ncbi:MAG: hypothetical protein RLZZ142_1768 [Verrucomicrobiota bacterium]
MKSAITVSLVPEARGGPFVFWDGLEAAFERAAALGFDAVEIFPSGPEAVEGARIEGLRQRTGLAVAAIGTGAGWVKHKLHLCSPESAVRGRARRFVAEMIEVAAAQGAPAILGSMQGRVEAGVERAQALDWLEEALREASELARQAGQTFLYEPLNRYETNLFNRQQEAAHFLEERGLSGVGILADWFHMNLEEANLGEALEALGPRLAHVHFADSNRRAVGFGHTDAGALWRVLRGMGYAGYLSAEVVAWPNSEEAAERTMRTFRALQAME